MNSLKNSIISKISAQFLLVASFLCILFGNGVHVHSMIDHWDLHVFVHAHDHDHSTSSEHEGDSHPFDSKENHHKVAKVDSNGVLVHSKSLKTQIHLSANHTAVISEAVVIKRLDTGSDLDLPPPDIIQSEFTPQSNSLRAPPLV